MPNPQQIQLSPQQFHSRFLPVSQFSDPFARQYFITSDVQSKRRTIYKHYLAEAEDQVEAIFDNIENYLKLNEQEDICKIVACVRLQEEQQVLAAFQYDELSLGQYIQTPQFHTSRPQFYIRFLSSLTHTIKSMCEIGIDLDQLNDGNILVYKDESAHIKIKVFYDEREKTYDKILEGYFLLNICRMKTFTSVEKLTALINNDEEYFVQMMDLSDGIAQENIYQLGLLLIDLMYASQTLQLPSSSQQFISRDRPVSRSSLFNPEKSYYHIEDGCIVSLNQDYLDQKLRYLENDCSQIVKELAILAKEMIKPKEERICVIQLIGEIERVEKIWRDMNSKKIVRTVSNQGKKVILNDQITNQPKQPNNQSINSEISSNVRKQNQSSQYYHQNILNGLDEEEGNFKYEYQGSSQKNQQSNFESQKYLKKQGHQQYQQANTAHIVTEHDSYSSPKIAFPTHTQSHHETVFSSYSSSQKNNYTAQNNNPLDQKQKLREATNSNALSTTKQTIASKTTYTAVVNESNFGPGFNSSNNLIQQHERNLSNGKPMSQTKFNDSFSDKPVKMVIPKEHILMSLKAHDSIKSSLQNLIKEVQSLPQLRKKQYYDNSVYYGSISSQTNKRSGLGLYVYPSGDVYFGTWSQNQLVNGTYIFKNGESYQGSVKNGKQGWGRYRYSNGNVYEGEWKDDIKEGKGTMWYPNQDKYEGQWVKGKKNGFGKYFYNNGTIYQGNFMNGRKHGFGTIFFPNGTRIEANWHQTHIQGEGKVHYPNGDFFHGEYYMSEKHGKGLYIWASDNTKYQGEFKKDTLEGEAKIYFTPNEYYFGRIRNGKRDGQGTYSYENGDSFTGEWKNDFKLIGHYTFKNGDQFQGKFKENQLNFGVLKYSNGEMYEGEFKNGYRHGVGSYRDRNGDVVCEGHWENDGFVAQGGH